MLDGAKVPDIHGKDAHFRSRDIWQHHAGLVNVCLPRTWNIGTQISSPLLFFLIRKNEAKEPEVVTLWQLVCIGSTH